MNEQDNFFTEGEKRHQVFEWVNLSIDQSDNPNALIRKLLFHMHSTIFQMRS